MTSYAIPRNPEWVRFVAEIISFLLAAFGVIHALVRFWQFQSTAMDDGNPSTWENVVLWGGLLIGMLYVVVGLVSIHREVSDLSREPNFLEKFWSHRSEQVGLSPLTLWFLTLSVFATIVVTAASLAPHRLYTPSGSLRVLETGEVVRSGWSATGNRYHVTSAVFPLSFPDQATNMEVAGRSGAVHILTSMDIEFADNGATTALIGGHARELEDKQGRNRFVTRALSSYLAPKLTELVREVAAGERSGSEASLKLGLADLIRRDTRKPPWLAGIRVNEVSVVDADVANWN